MTLAQLKTKLLTRTGTAIEQVYFDWEQFLNQPMSKAYPIVLWSLNGAKFQTDARTSTIQKIKTLTLTVFAIASFGDNTQDKIAVWDTLESQFVTYLNAMNETAGISIANIDQIKGEYVPDGMISTESEVGIMYQDVTIKMFC
jgi:hypothetical protein